MGKAKVVFALIVVLVSVALSLDALAESDVDEWAGYMPEDMYDPEEFTGLTGDWFGYRGKLADNGITMDIDIMQSFQGVVDGGTDSSWEYGGSAELNFQLDFKKIGLWPGAFINGRAIIQFGQFVNKDTGAIIAANTDGLFPLPDYDGVTLSQLVFTQFLSESFAVFLGKIDTTEGDSTAFSGARGKDNFMNQSLVFNSALARAVPMSSLGAGLIFIWPDVHAERPYTLAFSVLGADGMPNTAGFDDDFDDGEVYSAEFKLPTEFFGKDGNHTFGAVYSDKDLTLLDPDPQLIFGPIGLPLKLTLEEEEDTWGFTYNFDQYLFTEEGDKTQGFGLFGRYGFADDETSPIEHFWSIGLGGKGIIDGRDEDTFGIGYYFIDFSDKLPKPISDQVDNSYGFEIFYNIEVTPWLHITPDFQILEPSNEDVDTTYITGFRIRIDL
jgi:porin